MSGYVALITRCFRERALAAPLKPYQQSGSRSASPSFRERALAAPLKRCIDGHLRNDQSSFRERALAAPLKLFSRKAARFFCQLFPRARARGPIEAILIP